MGAEMSWKESDTRGVDADRLHCVAYRRGDLNRPHRCEQDEMNSISLDAGHAGLPGVFGAWRVVALDCGIPGNYVAPAL